MFILHLLMALWYNASPSILTPIYLTSYILGNGVKKVIKIQFIIYWLVYQFKNNMSRIIYKLKDYNIV
jgi:hypothetical protein